MTLYEKFVGKSVVIQLSAAVCAVSAESEVTYEDGSVSGDTRVAIQAMPVRNEKGELLAADGSLFKDPTTQQAAINQQPMMVQAFQATLGAANSNEIIFTTKSGVKGDVDVMICVSVSSVLMVALAQNAAKPAESESKIISPN